jgi:hypothetical protein
MSILSLYITSYTRPVTMKYLHEPTADIIPSQYFIRKGVRSLPFVELWIILFKIMSLSLLRMTTVGLNIHISSSMHRLTRSRYFTIVIPCVGCSIQNATEQCTWWITYFMRPHRYK